MSSQIKIFKQDVINFLTQNLNEKNIDDYITELKNYTNLTTKLSVDQQSIKMAISIEAIIVIDSMFGLFGGGEVTDC